MKIVKVENAFLAWQQNYKLEVTDLRFQKFSGEMSGVVRRYDLRRNDMVGILVLDTNTNEFILVEQFRYPVYKAGHETFVEIASGGIEEGENPTEAAKRECFEETGYKVNNLVLISEAFATPPYSSEKFYIYFAEASSSDFQSSKLGVENEDIKQVRLKTEDALSQIQQGNIKDMKTLLSIYWYFNTYNKS